MTTIKYDTIVVGGGIAGLTSAAYLARAGQNVLLLEKNEVCGGLVNTFSRSGFHFDAGVRALEDAGIIFPMLKDLGIEMEVVKSKVSLGLEDDIIHIENIKHLEDYKQLLIKHYSESENEIIKLLKVIRKIMKNMEVLYGVENPLFKNLKKDKQYVFKQLLPWLPKFIFTIKKINKLNIPVEEYLERIIKNKSLIDIVSQHFFKNTPTFFALSYFSLYLDYFYPKGGVGSLSNLLEEKINKLGGKILIQKKVVSVDVANCKITDSHNDTYHYENLIWAADLKTFYNLVRVDGLCAKICAKYENQKSKILKSKGADSVFTLYLQVDEVPESFEAIANGHFFYTPSKSGLGNVHRQYLNNLLSDWSHVSKDSVMSWVDKFTSLSTYEISIPALKDREMAPEGKTGLIISLLVDYKLFEKLEEFRWLEEFKKKLESRIIDVITSSVYPFLKNKIIDQFSFTPLGIKNRIGSSEGAIVGWSFEQEIPAVHKMQYSDKATLTPFHNIYQAGQWTFSPAGVPMCILTGKIAAGRICKKRK